MMPPPSEPSPSKPLLRTTSKASMSAKNNNKLKLKPLLRSSSTVSHQSANNKRDSTSSSPERNKPTSTGLAEWAKFKTTSSLPALQHGEGDPFLCHCTSCINFWKRAVGQDNTELLTSSPVNRSRSTGPMFYVKNLEVKLGDRVLVWRTHRGVVKYIGTLADDLVSPHLFIGVQLDDNINSRSSGVYNGKHYFPCAPGHGAFVKYKDIIVSEAAEKVPKTRGHEMFPSYRQIKRERKQRREEDPDYDIGITPRELHSRSCETLTQALPTSRKTVTNRTVYDPLDTAYKDYIRFVNEPPPKVRPQKKLTAKEKRKLELEKRFGGGDRAEKMVAMVEKLREAYKKGLEVRADENEYNV